MQGQLGNPLVDVRGKAPENQRRLMLFLNFHETSLYSSKIIFYLKVSEYGFRLLWGIQRHCKRFGADISSKSLFSKSPTRFKGHLGPGTEGLVSLLPKKNQMEEVTLEKITKLPREV